MKDYLDIEDTLKTDNTRNYKMICVATGVELKLQAESFDSEVITMEEIKEKEPSTKLASGGLVPGLAMSSFVLFYKHLRTSHVKFHSEIKAINAVAAFKVAVSIMHKSNMTPDEFESLYVAPVDVSQSMSYNKQRCGWDECGDFPRA